MGEGGTRNKSDWETLVYDRRSVDFVCSVSRYARIVGFAFGTEKD